LPGGAEARDAHRQPGDAEDEAEAAGEELSGGAAGVRRARQLVEHCLRPATEGRPAGGPHALSRPRIRIVAPVLIRPAVIDGQYTREAPVGSPGRRSAGWTRARVATL